MEWWLVAAGVGLNFFLLKLKSLSVWYLLFFPHHNRPVVNILFISTKKFVGFYLNKNTTLQ